MDKELDGKRLAPPQACTAEELGAARDAGLFIASSQDEPPAEVLEAMDAFNETVSGVILSWSPGKFALQPAADQKGGAMNLAGHEYSERELLRRSMKNWHTPKTKWSRVPRWVKAKEVF